MSQENFLTMHSLLSGLQLRHGAHISRGGMPMHRNLNPKAFPKREGTYTLTPEQLLSVRVPVVRIRHGAIEGYQKPFNPGRARQIARWIKDNRREYMKTLPAIEISLGSDGTPFATDGQHRMGGAIIEGVPLKAIVTKRNTDQQRRLFALQGKAQRPSRNLLIFDSDGPFEEYIQDAVTSNGNHPWSSLISAAPTGGGSKTRMSATAAYGMLKIFISGRTSGSEAGRSVGLKVDDAGFDKDAGDQLAYLMASFGDRQANPLAYSAMGLRAIAIAARAVFRSKEPHPDDFSRWIKHMPSFKFADYIYVKSSIELADQMVRHWNRRLADNRKAARID